jgi:hypothetical protein
MPELTYYIVNHTTKEYCDGEYYNESIFTTLDKLLEKYSNWKKEHNIRIIPESHSSMEAYESLKYNLEYKNLDNPDDNLYI